MRKKDVNAFIEEMEAIGDDLRSESYGGVNKRQIVCSGYRNR